MVILIPEYTLCFHHDDVLFTEWQDQESNGAWTDLEKTESSTWQWSSGSTWVNWSQNEPNGNGVCAMVYWSGYTFDDIECHATFPYVCEIYL